MKIIMFFTLFLPLVAIASEQNLDHIHGQGILIIEKAKNGLQVDFITPSSNILDYEYKPKSKRDIGSWVNVRKSWKTMASNFYKLSPKCKLKDVKIEMFFDSENKSLQKRTNKLEGNHSEIRGRTTYDCQKSPSKLGVYLFEVYPKLKKINVVIQSEKSKKKTFQITAKNRSIDL